MVLKAGPIFRALDAIAEGMPVRSHVILTSPQGTRFTQAIAKRLSNEPHLVLLCGRYEGVDERVRLRVDEELSAGDFVLTGGELPALMIVDAVARLIPGVVGDEESVDQESFSRGLLDFPHYTRPAVLEWTGGPADALKVPDVLVSGNHAEIRRWRRRAALARTLARRPELLDSAPLDAEERTLLEELRGTLRRENESAGSDE
jgi:tRNA (guanine37-N1)-methyltransferase